jgi:tripartite-type tricarboxylate transporter receptor subunit TctC
MKKLLLPALLLLAAARPALAQDYPNHPIRMIVPFAAGSTPDIFARIVGDKASQLLKAPIVIDNRAGAGGNLGTDLVAKAAPDGYTLGASITGPLVNNTVLYKKLPYDPFRDLAPITFGVHQPNVLAVSPSLGVHNMQELFALLKKNPGKYNYASIGAGSLSHLSMELIKDKTGTFIVHIPYSSSPAAVTSVIAGDTQMASLAPLAIMPQVAAGKLKELAISTPQRSPLLPNIPTFREAGILSVEATAWIGIVAPAHTPQAIIDRLNREFVAALKDPATVEKLRAQYMDPNPGTPAEFAAFMRAELARWAPVIKRSGASAD